MRVGEQPGVLYRTGSKGGEQLERDPWALLYEQEELEIARGLKRKRRIKGWLMIITELMITNC